MTKRIEPRALSVLLYLTDEHYRQYHSKPPAALTEINLPKLLQASCRNKLAYQMAYQALHEDNYHPLLEEVVLAGKRNLELQRQTMEFISRTLGDEGIEFLIIKSYKALPYITADIDIMVKEPQYKATVRILQARGAYHNERLHRIPLPPFIENRLKRAAGANLLKDGLLEMDVYQNTTWTGWLCLDNEFIWRETRTVDICGVKCLIPGREADLLLSLAHVIFCHGSINLLDFLYMNDLLEKITNFDELFLEAEKYHWSQALRALISRMQLLYQTCTYSPEIMHPVSFPYLIPLHIIFNAYRGAARAAERETTQILSDWFTILLKLATILVYR